MRRVNPSGFILAALSISLLWAPGAGAQAPASKRPAAKAAATKAAGSRQATALVRRDPFDPLVKAGRGPGGQADVIDPGIPGIGGLVISTLRVDGVVRSPNGMIAVISNPQNRVYFVREGARVYDGVVEKISLDSVTFRQRGKDPFGQTVERPVTKRVYPRAGEQ